MAKKRLNYLVYILFMALLFFYNLQTCVAGNGGTIEGLIVDDETGNPLEAVTIVLKGTSRGASSDDSGHFLITNISAGKYVLVVSRIGYKKYERELTLTTDDAKSVEVHLKPAAFNLGELVVTATKTEHLLADVPVPTSVITAKQLESTNSQTVGDILRWLPGISTSDDGYSKSVARIQGMHPKHTMVLVNGQRIKGGHNETIDLSHIDVESIQQIEVIKGPSSALYGSEALGGVINVITKKPADHFNVNASSSFGSYNSQYHRIAQSGTLSKFGYALYYLRRSSNAIGDEVNEYVANEVQGAFEYGLTSQSKLQLNTGYIYQEDGDSEYEYKKFNSNGAWIWTPSVNTMLKLSGFVYNMDFKNSSDELTQDDTYRIETQLTQSIGQRHIVTLGLENRFDKLNSERITNKEQTLYSIYAQDEWNTFSTLDIVLGTRVDYHNLWGSEVNPKFSALYKAIPDTRLRFSFGRGFRAPTLSNIYSVTSPVARGRFYLVGNKDLKPETSMGYQLGIEYEGFNNMLMQVSFFHNRIENLIDSTPIDLDYQGTGKKLLSYRNVASAITQGIELQVQAKIFRNLTGSLGYTYLQTEDRETGKELSLNPQNKFNTELQFSQPQIDLNLNLRAEFVGESFDDDENSVTNNSYTLLHFKVSKKLWQKHLETFLSVDNLLNQKYSDDALYLSGRTFLAGFRASF